MHDGPGAFSLRGYPSFNLREDNDLSDDRPVRDTFLPFSRPSLGEAEIGGVVEVLKSGWITTGPKTRAFEEQFAAYVGAKHALAVTSGTGGEHITLLSMGIGPGDEVITSPMTWASSVNMIVAVGATPVLVDVDPRTFNIDPAQVAKKITARTRAIIPVHFAGLACDLDALSAIAAPHGIPILEDAAHAVGTHYKGGQIGSHGNTAIYSFHPIKNITTGEGGMVTTDDDALAAQIRLWRFHGVNRDSWARSGKGGAGGYDVLLPGFKYNMLDLQAALGIAQLARLEEFIARRTELAEFFLAKLGGLEELQLPVADPGFPARHAWHLFTPLVDVDRLDCDRFEFMDELKNENIGTGLHFLAVHLNAMYEKRFGYRRGDFPNAERISDRILSLPLFPSMTDRDAQDVVDAVVKVVRRHRKVGR